MPTSKIRVEEIKALRHAKRLQRNQLPLYIQHQHSRRICQRLNAMPMFRAAKHIAVYMANDGEVDLSLLWTGQHNKQFYLPIIRKQNEMHFAAFNNIRLHSQLCKGPWGLMEPPPSKIIPSARIDMVLAPLVAFDGHGQRLGRGGGFYDRFLSQYQKGRKPTVIGIAHACQKIEKLQSQPWDIPLDAVCTERYLHYFPSAKRKYV